MTKNYIDTLTVEEQKAMEKALKWVATSESLKDAVNNDYLTINKGRDGKIYAWYFDGTSNAAVEVESLNIIADEEEIENLFC